MSVINCNKDIVNYHADKVVLSKAQQVEMRGRRDSGRTRLENGLAKAEHPSPKMICSQGSYAMRTMVQDEDNDYDIDDGVYFETENLVDANGNSLAPYDARKRVKKALYDERLNYDAVIKNNCVRQLYPAGYHIDLPVYRILRSKNIWGEEVVGYELASGDEWVESDARAVTSWFNTKVAQDLQSGDSDYSQLRRLVRLTKKMARSRKSWKSKTTSGICISKLVVDNFVSVADRDDEALHSTWRAMNSSLQITTQIRHPVLNKNLAEHNDEAVQFFKSCLSDNLKILEVLNAHDCTRNKALKAWGEAFNTDYFNSLLSEQKTSSESLLQPVSIAAGGLTFPDKPVVPNKSSGFA